MVYWYSPRNLSEVISSETAMKKQPFFIIGTQRSGTTLLFQIFDNHQDLFVVNEIWHLYPFVQGENRDLGELERLLQSHLGLEEPYLTGDQPAPRAVFDHVELAFEARLRELGKKRWAIKHPRLTYFMEDFRRRFPESQWVFIIRDGRGVVNSYLTRKWNVANVYYGARLWQEQIAIQRTFIEAHPEQSHVLHFESLLANPRQEVESICRFLGEDFSDDLLSYHQKRPTTRIHDGNVNITRPIQKSVGEKWRTQLTKAQIGVIEAVAGETLEAEGYELTGGSVSLSPIHRAFYGLHQAVMTNYWWQKRSGWTGIRKRLGMPVPSRPSQSLTPGRK